MSDWRDLNITNAELARRDLAIEKEPMSTPFLEATNRSIGPVFEFPEDQDFAWLHKSACRGLDPNLFVPEGRGADTGLSQQYARAVCRSCVVRVECEEYMHQLPSSTKGILAEMSERQRRRQRRA